MPAQKRNEHYLMSLRLRPAMGDLLEMLSKQMGIPRTNVLALGLRELAKREGVPIPEDREEQETAARAA